MSRHDLCAELIVLAGGLLAEFLWMLRYTFMTFIKRLLKL